MTVNTGTTTSENTPSANGSGVPTIEALTAAFSGARYMGEMDWDEPLEPDGHAAPAAPPVREALMRALLRLAARRQPHEIAMATYRNGDDAGLGTALQLVTDYTPLLTESITVLLRRQGVAIVDLMDPVFSVERAADGTLLSAAPVDHPQSDTAPNAECWIHLQLPPSIDAERLAFIETQLPHTLEDGSHVAADTDAMRDAVIELASDLDAAPGNARFSSAELTEVANLLRWLVDGNFTLLGYQRCTVENGHATVDESSRLGLLKRREEVLPQLTHNDQLLVLAQATTPTYLRYAIYPNIVVIRQDNGSGPAIEHRLVGVFTVAAMNADVLAIPVVCDRVHQVLGRSDATQDSLAGHMLIEFMQNLPRAELFASSVDRLYDIVTASRNIGAHPGSLLFLRADELGNFVTALVYLPRDRYTTTVRLAMQDTLVRELGGTGIDYTARVSESPWALVHFTVRLPENSPHNSIDTSEANRVRIQGLLTQTTRTWSDRLVRAVRPDSPIDRACAERYSVILPEVFKQNVPPAEAIADIARIEGLQEDSIDLAYDADELGTGVLSMYLGGRSASLSQVLPVLHSMGVDVLEERPYHFTRPDGLAVSLYAFRIVVHPAIARTFDAEGTARRADLLTRAIDAVWHGRVETDRFNELVLRAGLSAGQITILRGYAKYLRQAGFPYSQAHIETVLADNSQTARDFVELFEARFDPESTDDTIADAKAAQVLAEIDKVVSLDTDRVLRAFFGLIQATLRTNYFVKKEDSARAKGVLSFKLNPREIAELPEPRPRFEIFVYSPRVEGVHLRFGPVARGGLRWSDRREDFRTEILGLVKAQAVKNAVIVPVGAKGGFVVKNPPAATGDAAADRDAFRAEGVECYRRFISGLLDITDNRDRTTNAVVPPEGVRRRDGDDPYLVVAADKGTATFSDIANDVALSYGFWLGDAFASGGSVGYDHKAMGITARGAWESVKRHFLEIGIDTQTQDFTVVGVGDMSGDVFGNGMLLSQHIKLVAAFDHRHIFLDPNPDPASSWAERKRMFALERSSWADYNSALISAGGGVYSKEQKSIPISPEVRDVLGLDSDAVEMTPPQLVRAILLAPVDLFFNGGIGTYVKAESESQADVGDKANDAVRVNGNQVRAKVIGEGGNLGLTSRGRIEFELNGGRVNTDALDNSAGVDCSDHEVNIKILIDSLVSAGKIEASERTALLESMTDDVATLVLADNESQNNLMGTSRANAASLLSVHARQIAYLVNERGLDRELEALPSEKEIDRRAALGIGLTSPELATLMAHVKLGLKDDLLASDAPDQEVTLRRMVHYFPDVLRERFDAEIRQHPLRKEIYATMLVNSVVDCGGITYVYRLFEDAGTGSVDGLKTYVAVEAIFGLRSLWDRIRHADVPVAVSDRLTLDMRRLLDRASRWLISYRPQPLAVGAEINRFAEGIAELSPKLTTWLRGHDLEIVTKQTEDLVALGVPFDLASDVASCLYGFSLLDIIDIADIADRDGAEVADLYFTLMDDLRVDDLLTAVSQLERNDRWHSLARLAIRDDIYSSLRALTMDVLSVGEPDETGEQKIAEWEFTNASRLERARGTLAEIFAAGEPDLATLSVAARQIRGMIRSSITGPA